MAGSWLGWGLAKKGVTADNALKHNQRQVYLIGCITLGAVTLISILLAYGRNSPWIPSFLLLYVGAYFWYTILLICFFCTGLLLLLELTGWKDRQRLQQLTVFLSVSFLSICFLLYQSLPITDLVESPRVLDGVVFQTTPYSCAAATIATLVRKVNPNLNITERDVVKIAGTSRLGTTTLAEIQAMEELGLKPQYERNLTIKDLANRRQMAVLHVMEPVAGQRIQHAIALFEIDFSKGNLTVANPLYGKQIKTFEGMKDYWLGEAIFVTVASKKV
ncbi:cysteine peptidase family C39 domain-containing protein [Pseudanabaena sp. BC1403]|uniref:cysteine peptidase family C39 domain-containing protein n=1 Tax=Pseudanabaena sp. BC1403 TaxID=2043171 RepID=UPI0015E1A6A3|nr:cysteine peptidase family C39 domain-containing protein [Pseudanabaena sp. BC1403]